MLSRGQKAIAKSNKRFKVISAGRRFGKTYLAMRELCKQARMPNKQVWYISPSYRQSKQTIWAPLKAKLLKMQWVAKINESELTILLVNGSIISLKGADNPDSLRGVGLDYIVLDEFAYVRKEAWTEVLRPTLSDKQGSAMFITTPAGKGNWAFDLFNAAEYRDDWQAFQYTTLDGGRVPQEEIDQAKEDLDERTFRQEYEASFETYSGAIYYAFDNKANVSPYTGEALKQIIVGMDFNNNPMSATIGVQLKDHIHIIDEIVIPTSNTQEMCDEIKHRYKDIKVTVYPDPAGVQMKTSAGGNSDISILQNNGFAVKYKRKHPAVIDRINAVNAALSSANGTVKLLIDPKCKRTIECLIKHEYKKDTRVPNKDSGFDHQTDALGYKIDFIYPITKDIVKSKPQYMTVRTT